MDRRYFAVSLNVLTFLAVSFVALLAGCDTVIDGPNDPATPFKNVEENKGQWVWIPIDESLCRDGSTTGFGFRYQDEATAAVIFLQGGGACYDENSCGATPSSYTPTDFQNYLNAVGRSGFFNTGRTENPFADMHHIFVPYCTGDLHSSSTPGATVEGVTGQQQFVGYDNMTQLLDRLGPYLTSLGIDSTTLAGSSAGAFGAYINYPQVKAALPNTHVSLLADALPLFNDTAVMPACFQDHIRSVIQPRIPSGCTDCADPNRGGMSNLYPYLSATYPDQHFALITSTEDLWGRALLGNALPASCPTRPLLGARTYEDGLIKLRDEVLRPTGNWSTFFWPGFGHTIFLSENTVYNVPVDGVDAAAWAARVNAAAPVHIARR